MQKAILPQIIITLLFAGVYVEAFNPATDLFTIARLKYAGGGDWYNDPSAVPNLMAFLRQETNIPVAEDEVKVEIGSEELFSYPFVYMTGHGNIRLTDDEALRLRIHLQHGGFLYADDDYGMDGAFRREIRKVFPKNDLVELPPSHGIFHCYFDFPNGLPKIHEHDGKPPVAYGMFHQGRLVVLYTYETNISDGWVDPDVHKDPPEKRIAALRMGTNIVVWALTH
ncbi:MAG: DUF4159 domain-containing protein [Candidatus Latescibacteria bacterium]|nr:DUF4159 domain-containing protein [Candidatus Latescibacterota bacterium]